MMESHQINLEASLKKKIIAILNSLIFSIQHIIAYSGKDNLLREQKNLFKILKKEQKLRDKLIKFLSKNEN